MRGHDILILVVALLLVLPITIFNYKLTGIPLSDLVCLAGVYFFLKNIYLPLALMLFLSLSFALFSAILGIALYDLSPVLVLGSLLFLFKPCFAYFVSLSLIKSWGDVRFFFFSFSWLVVVLIISVFFSLLFSYGMVVRAEGVLNGDFWGIPLFGAYGVNSLAAFYVMLSLGLVFTILYINGSSRAFFVFIAVFFLLGFLIFLTVSRMAVLGFVVVLIGLIVHLMRNSLLKGIVVAFLILLVAFIVFAWAHQSGLLDAKLNQIAQGLNSGDFNYLSSGRIDLYLAAITQILSSPFWGAAFGGYEVTFISIDGYDSLAGLSPHNQYITLLWKMGFPAAISYLLFLGLAVKSSLNSYSELRGWAILLSLVVLLIFCAFWDALLIPNVAAVYFFFLGVLSNERRKKS